MAFCWWGMVQRGTPSWGLATSPTGSLRIHGATDGENTAITGFAGAMACVGWTLWSLQWWLKPPKTFYFTMLLLFVIYIYTWMEMSKPMVVPLVKYWPEMNNKRLFNIVLQQTNCREYPDFSILWPWII